MSNVSSSLNIPMIVNILLSISQKMHQGCDMFRHVDRCEEESDTILDSLKIFKFLNNFTI